MEHDAIEEFARFLAPYIECPPVLPPTVTVRPTPLQWDETCEGSGGYWKGKRKAPARIIDIIPISHELDILEARLYELDDGEKRVGSERGTTERNGTVLLQCVYAPIPPSFPFLLFPNPSSFSPSYSSSFFPSSSFVLLLPLSSSFFLLPSGR